MRRPDAGGILQYWPHVRYKSLSKDPNASRGKALEQYADSTICFTDNFINM